MSGRPAADGARRRTGPVATCGDYVAPDAAGTPRRDRRPALFGIVVVGTVGYVLLASACWTPPTRRSHDHDGRLRRSRLDGAGQVFTIVLILAGVGTALYTLTVGLELIVEGHLGAVMERRRMDKRIDGLRNHVILCGWGRVGRAIPAASQ
jgi:voltage-gated potassium channel